MVIAMALAGGGARAAVLDATPSGFQVEQTVTINAPADKVWTSLGQFGAWWDSAHSWSHDASNFALDLRPGGCLCETLPNGGGARHLSVIFVIPGKTAILEGTLGPLMFSGAGGHLVWKLAAAGGQTTLTQDYYVGGYFKGGLDALAPAVDGVLTDQLGRLKRYVETGKPS
jgi:hypothetical protein